MKHFQVIQNYGQGTLGFLYFQSDATAIEELEKIAVKQMIDDWNEKRQLRLVLHSPVPARPTITVQEYDQSKHRKKRGGIVFKTTWR